MLLCSGLGFAQFSDEELYTAYLVADMSVWDRYLRTTEWDDLSLLERTRYINYEYGYIATAIDTKQPDAKEQNERFKSHIDAMQSVLPQATILTYLSSYAAYRAKLSAFEFLKQGLRAKTLAQQAVEADGDNPLALTLLGCVDFYAPSILGGNKNRALANFEHAKEVFIAQGDTILNWNYASLQMQLAMCLDKTGHRQEAIELCQSLLAKDSNFLYIRDTYLPTLLK